jgi:ADP-heptose:LPS heptosyltransferase
MTTPPFFNTEYFQQTFEETFLMRLSARRIRPTDISNGKILVIAPARVGEFVTMIPALVDFIKRNNDKKVDAVVASNVKGLAEKIRGIGKVFVGNPVAGTGNESAQNDFGQGAYEKVLILRASSDIFKNIAPRIEAREVMNAASLMSHYGMFDLWKSVIMRKRPTQWRDFCFTLLGGKPRKFSFDEMFDFSGQELSQASDLISKIGTGKKIIVHTGASWPMMRWNLDKWVELIKRIHNLGSFDIVFIGGGQEQKDYDAISSKLGFRTNSLIGKLNVEELLLLMRKADYFLGIDSGPGNLAHLAKLPSLILYGPGPHMYMSDDPRDIAIDKSNGRGLFQRFFSVKNSFIEKISVGEAYDAFVRLISAN